MDEDVYCTKCRCRMVLIDYARIYKCNGCGIKVLRYPKRVTLEKAIDNLKKGKNIYQGKNDEKIRSINN